MSGEPISIGRPPSAGEPSSTSQSPSTGGPSSAGQSPSTGESSLAGQSPSTGRSPSAGEQPEPAAPWAAPDPAATDGLVDLTAYGDGLLGQAHADARGKASAMLVRGPHQRVMLIALAAGGELGEHSSPPAATLQCLRGEAVLHSGPREWRLTPGSLVPIPPERHGVRTVGSDALLLLTVTPPRP